MAKTIEEGFREFHCRLTPTGGESQAASTHLASIAARLKSDFEMSRFFRTGSFGNGTSIRGFSDVDYFASIPRKHVPQNSISFLVKIRNSLDERFPNTGVTIRTPAVLVPFGKNGSESTEVVPADFIKQDDNGYRIYEIADGNSGWMRASPDAHNAYVDYANSKRGNKVKPLIRFLKAWKYLRAVNISSFYLEMRVAKYALAEESIVYSIDVKRILRLLWDQQLAAMQDPMGISGYIKPCLTEAQKIDAISKLQTALTRAEKALVAEHAGKIEDAFYWWNLVFAEAFPAYR